MVRKALPFRRGDEPGNVAVSVIVPFREEVDTEIIDGVKSRDWEIIRVPIDDTFERAANRGAFKASGDVLVLLASDSEVLFETIDKMIGRLKTAHLVGSYFSMDGYPHVSGSCLVIARRAYEDCGLFNERLDPGLWNRLEIHLRYNRAGYSCQHVKVDYDYEEGGPNRNGEYLQKVYGVKV